MKENRQKEKNNKKTDGEDVRLNKKGEPILYKKKTVILICAAAALVVALTVILLVLLGKESAKEQGTTAPGGSGETSGVVIDGTTDDPSADTTATPGGDTGNTPDSTDAVPGGDTTTDTDTADTDNGGTTDPAPIADKAEIGRGFYLVSFQSYSGAYVEDMSDEEVSDIAAAVIRNDGDEMIQLVDFSVYAGGTAYEFRATTIPAGAEMLVLEKNRAAFPGGDYDDTAVTMLAEFQEEPSVYKDSLSVTGSDGMIYVENISGEDIKNDISVFFKTYRDGMYIGGITYMATFKDGIAAGANNMLGANHFDIEDSRIMFIKYGE